MKDDRFSPRLHLEVISTFEVFNPALSKSHDSLIRFRFNSCVPRGLSQGYVGFPTAISSCLGYRRQPTHLNPANQEGVETILVSARLIDT